MASFTLGDLLDVHLGLTLVRGGEQARTRVVLGAHSTEIERPAAWLDHGWILLTTGLRLRHDTAAQRALVADVDQLGGAAIGFGLGIAYERIPRALLDEADRRAVPVFTVPLATPFHEVVRTVHRAQSDTDALDLQRLSATQLQLMDALGEPRPRQAVIDRLAELTNATTLLFSPTGALLARSGAAPENAVFSAIEAHPGPLAETTVDDRHLLATSISSGTRTRGWLALLSARPHPAGRLTRPATRASARILAALMHLDDVAFRHERAIGRSLLTELLDPPPDARPAELEARSAAHGLALDGETAIVLFERPPSEEQADLLDDWDAHASAAALRQLSIARGPRAIAVLVRDPLHASRGTLESFTAESDVVAGIGRPATAAGEVPRSLRDAALALRVAARRTEDGEQLRVHPFADLDLATFLAGTAPPDDAVPLAEALLAPIRARRHLEETLACWFAHDCDTARAAKALRLRPNSLRYRLARVEQLLGQPLRRPQTVASLHLALAVSPPKSVEAG